MAVNVDWIRDATAQYARRRTLVFDIDGKVYLSRGQAGTQAEGEVMGAYLDIDDVAAGNPVAEKQLAELRAEIERLKLLCAMASGVIEKVRAFQRLNLEEGWLDYLAKAGKDA